MQKKIEMQARIHIKRHKRRKIWHKVVGSLACVVVFATTYMLILPAITMEQTSYCGIEAHKHSDSCYEERLICDIPEEQEVSHIHDETCIKEEQLLNCSEEHEHMPECYETVTTYICEPVDEKIIHTHGPECYEKVLICQMEEHEHSLPCFSNPNADVETKDIWERSVSGVKLTGVWSDDVIAIANTQMGYSESKANYLVTEDGKIKGITRYGQWYGDSYGDWCAMFASFCLKYGGIPESAMPYEASCNRWIEKLSQPDVNRYESAQTYIPKKGDLVFFDWNSDKVSDHVGIVAECKEVAETNSVRIKVIEGNASDCVKQIEYETTDTKIMGYGKLPENPDLEKKQADEKVELTAKADDGIIIHISGPASSFPVPADEITITANKVEDENASALVDAAASDTQVENGSISLYDIRLWHEGEEIEPIGSVVLSFDGFFSEGESNYANVYHVEPDENRATNMNAETTKEGNVLIDTDHFSLYAVMVAQETRGAIHINSNLIVSWNDTEHIFDKIIFKASNSITDATYRVEYSDNEGATWHTIISSGNVRKGETATLDITSSVSKNTPINRWYRVYCTKDKNNFGSTEPLTLQDLFSSVKAGFQDWVKNSYVQDFGGPSIPTTTEELYHAFSVYYALPTLNISSRMEGNTMYVDAQMTGTGTYNHKWEYLDETENWVPLCKETGGTINASTIDILQDGGKKIRCSLTENGKIKATSNILFVNPKQQLYDRAISEINQGLNLGELSINGSKFKDYFYYDNVAKDSRVPFSDAKSYADYLAKTYLDYGGGQAGLEKVRAEWNKYLYDMYDPTSKTNVDLGYPGIGSTYGDKVLSWPKDSTSSFHGTLKPVVDPLDYNYLENGVDYSNFVSALKKKTTTVKPGDANEERKYDVDLLADGQAKCRGPVAMVLQIQTSWQMFDLKHANANIGEGKTQKGPASKNTELATLYDIKHALLRFVDYMEKEYPGNNLVIGITETQHAGSQTMFQGTDHQGKPLYVTNNYNTLRKAIRQWDSFGNCEHVHYDTKNLVNAISNLSSNLDGWKDVTGQNNIPYEKIQKIAVVIGGPTENSSDENGYGCSLPWDTFSKEKINSVYGIRTNKGTPLNSAGIISWIDFSKNNSGVPFKDGIGNAFTDKYVASTEDAVFHALVDIAKKEMNAQAMDIEKEGPFVEDVVVKDTVSEEFVLDKTTPMTVTIYNKDMSVESTKTISWNGTSWDDPNLSVTDHPDGTTTVQYKFDKVYNPKKYGIKFRIQAKEDYIGSNNVYSNRGTPDLNYKHYILDSSGTPTGEEKKYDVFCTDTPQVNVPIRYDVVDGDSVSILLNEKVDLADLSTNIAKKAEELIDNYKQINGKLSYTWVLPDGREMNFANLDVRNGSIGSQTFPDRSSIFEGVKEGQFMGTLKLTFTPQNVDSSNKNFSDKNTAVAVKPLQKPGNVWINVVSPDSKSKFIVRKVWEGEPPAGIDEIKFRILANGIAVTDDNGTQLEYTISKQNNWEKEISGLPVVKDGVIQNYTVEEINQPAGYIASYSSDTHKENVYAAKVTLSFTPKKGKIDNAWIEITYRYNGTDYVHREYGTFEHGHNYSYEVKELPLNDQGEPFSCELISVKKASETKSIELSNKSATAEKYLNSSTNTEVKVITNSPAYELPQTGGIGTSLYASGGVLLIISAVSLLLYNIIKRRKEDGFSS